MAFSAACQQHMMMQYCCDSTCTSKLFCMYFLLLHEANELILDMWLYWLIFACTRLLILHSSVSVANGMSHHE